MPERIPETSSAWVAVGVGRASLCLLGVPVRRALEGLDLWRRRDDGGYVRRRQGRFGDDSHPAMAARGQSSASTRKTQPSSSAQRSRWGVGRSGGGCFFGGVSVGVSESGTTLDLWPAAGARCRGSGSCAAGTRG